MRARATKSPRKGRLVLWAILCLSGGGYEASAATTPALIRNNFGSLGMIEMPSARMAPDGELSVGASFFLNTQHYNFGFQILPWLETSFRYSGLQHFDPAYPVYYDRSFGVKARLWDETKTFPAVAIGINDIVGTGIYSGEYIVASKQFGAFDASLGLGWGRLGNSKLFENPLEVLSTSFRSRVQYPDISPGSTSFNSLFHGSSVGLFGGVIWHTPIDHLSLIAEYSSDTYTVEASRGNLKPRTQMNYGASYQASDNITVELGWLYGRSVSGSILFALNPTKAQYTAKLAPPLLDVAARSPDEQQIAVQTLLHPYRNSAPSLQQGRIARADFADALWQQKGLKDIQINGQSLLLTASGNLGKNCIAVAKLAENYGSAIKAVQIRSTDTARPVECLTASASAAPYQTIVASPESAVRMPIEFAAVHVIDAVALDPKAVAAAVRDDARKQQIKIEAVSFAEGIAIVYYTNSHYYAEQDALDRLTRILMKNAPPYIEKFRFIAVANGVPQQEFDILRSPEERKFSQTETLDLLGDSSTVVITPPPMQNPILTSETRPTYPRLSWSVFPQLRQELFDPEDPLAIQLTAAAMGSVELLRGLTLNGEAETSVFDNFNIHRASDSTLPHVRSDFLKYFSRGKTGIGQLDTQYRFRLAPTVFGVVKAGYLESMFAGAGGEVLWRPEGQRWALGADVYEVWQRGFDRLLDLQEYKTFTGHVSLYYDSPWHDLNFMVSAGQYLARDRGITFQVTRRFSTGVEVGAFFTKTNISSRQFGEGSFDKGIIIRIPLGWAIPIESRGEWEMDLRPVQRDGGQRLLGDATLYEETKQTSEGELSRLHASPPQSQR